jgi:NADPH:quinone reductase-like Zn-dependent oxidoreductase
VTAVCSTGKIATVSALGADRIIDYTTTDFTSTGERYDLIYAPNGNHPLAAYRRALEPTGIAVFTGGTGPQLMQAMLFGPFLSRKGGQQIRALVMKPRQEDLTYLADLLAAGTIRPVIDRTYPLAEVAEAVRYLEAGHANGKVIVTVNGVTE